MREHNGGSLRKGVNKKWSRVELSGVERSFKIYKHRAKNFISF